MVYKGRQLREGCTMPERDGIYLLYKPNGEMNNRQSTFVWHKKSELGAYQGEYLLWDEFCANHNHYIIQHVDDYRESALMVTEADVDWIAERLQGIVAAPQVRAVVYELLRIRREQYEPSDG